MLEGIDQAGQVEEAVVLMMALLRHTQTRDRLESIQEQPPQDHIRQSALHHGGRASGLESVQVLRRDICWEIEAELQRDLQPPTREACLAVGEIGMILGKGAQDRAQGPHTHLAVIRVQALDLQAEDDNAFNHNIYAIHLFILSWKCSCDRPLTERGTLS
jgi:hypothetical protein